MFLGGFFSGFPRGWSDFGGCFLAFSLDVLGCFVDFPTIFFGFCGRVPWNFCGFLTNWMDWAVSEKQLWLVW